MNLYIITTCIFVLIISSSTVNYALGQIDPLTEIDFLQSGLIYLENFLMETSFVFQGKQ